MTWGPSPTNLNFFKDEVDDEEEGLEVTEEVELTGAAAAGTTDGDAAISTQTQASNGSCVIL